MAPDPVPEAWATRTQAEKFAWLDTQACPGNPIVSLGAAYRRGAGITDYFHSFYNMLQILAKEFQVPGSDKTKRLFCRLVNAFNDGVFKLMTAIYNDCLFIIVHGRVDDEPPVLDAVSSEQLSGFEALLMIPPTEDEVCFLCRPKKNTPLILL